MAVADEVYEALITPIEDRMIRSVTRILRDPDDAADALQNALLVVWKNLRKIEKHSNPHGYIIRICSNAAIDTWRRRVRDKRRNAPLDSAAPLSVPAEQESDAIVNEKGGRFTRCWLSCHGNRPKRSS